MPELNFQITEVQPASHGMTPLMDFTLEIANAGAGSTIHSVLLQTQIRIESTQRPYNAREKEKLADLFGTPDRWGQTLRSRLWTHVTATAGTFTDSTTVRLPVACTYDMNVASAKYFYALEEGDIPLLFLFSGTIFYADPEGRLQVEQISWNKECSYRLPVARWQYMMEQHYPNSAWLYLQRDVFDQLYAYKRRQGIPTWEATIERLLPGAEGTP